MKSKQNMESKLKGILVLLAIIILPTIGEAQLMPPHSDSQISDSQKSNEKAQFLTDGKGVRLSAFGTYDFEVSQIGNQLAVGNGGSGALIFNRSMYFGLYGMGIVYDINDFDFDPDIDFEDDFEIKALGHGGLLLGGVFTPSKVVHAGASLKLGLGDLVVGDQDLVRNDFVFIAQPQIEAELNVARWFKIKAGAGYRYASGLRTDSYYSDDYLNSLTGSLSLIFGWFGERRIFERSKDRRKRYNDRPEDPNSLQMSL